jgi:hypothetical protein
MGLNFDIRREGCMRSTLTPCNMFERERERERERGKREQREVVSDTVIKGGGQETFFLRF